MRALMEKRAQTRDKNKLVISEMGDEDVITKKKGQKVAPSALVYIYVYYRGILKFSKGVSEWCKCIPTF